jgi:hypothetical protein
VQRLPGRPAWDRAGAIPAAADVPIVGAGPSGIARFRRIDRRIRGVTSRLDGLYTLVYRQIREILEKTRATAARSVHTAMVRAYWLVGRKVVEEEQSGSARAGYGDELIDQLAARLRADFGRGFTLSNLRYMRLFYLAYPNLLAREIHHAVRDESQRRAGEGSRPAVAGHDPDRGGLNPDLSWTHYRLLTKVESPLARDFYEIEAARNHWSSRELER